ncbi:uncharacterized protein A1O9_04295 [Exophiala aquamarina CBS 119918]|uniref:Midasin n=1 Tax=Exophiala aquamarina CBS 119918 TaxID=1182545 RepID=A0A072PHU7_9EURO|nr:uncharacterized protein A1O9_04295 [Exophiala aquamarina CBS 119918]KEF59451.1 hypothetical protein A1O9_04295 [Exophiala aquamarina CBS 119918]
MEDIAVYCSWANAQLEDSTSFLKVLPTEIRSQIVRSTGSQYFSHLAQATKLPQYSDVLSPLYTPLLPELAARWTAPAKLGSNLHEEILTLATLARLLPVAAYLKHHVQTTLEAKQLKTLFETAGGEVLPVEDEDLSLLLIALFRLLSHDRDVLSPAVGPSFFSLLLNHASLSVRYVSVQCLCLYMHFADAFSEKLVGQYVGTDAILGPWEGRTIDFRVLKLWEEKRWRDLDGAISHIQERWQNDHATSAATSITLSTTSPNTASVGGVLVPRMGELEIPMSTFVQTPTSRRNLSQVGKYLLQKTPLLLTGEAGSGKTSLVREAARLLNKLSTMITLHLNEQTDAKSLLGLYTSSADGETFSWRPGVLTKAMQQGRWVLIEDIDRAPAEVMGVLRPILESGELFIVGRKERIIPAEGFHILATMRTSGGRRRTPNSRYSWLFNPRLWNTIETATYEPAEIESLLHARHPEAESFIPTILRVHQHVCRMYEDEPRLKALQSRKPSLRDLLVWSRRVVRRLASHSPRAASASASASIPQRLKVDIFKDAVDIYAGYLNDELLHDMVASCVAQEMDISPQQMQHSLLEEVSITSSKASEILIVGRNALKKVVGGRTQVRNHSFALTASAQRALDRISASVSHSEPCLLVGETGVGKTSLVQHIASLVGQKLTVVNLSQQSEASDLLGGLKPVTTRSLILPLVDKFNALFEDTFSTKRNEKFQLAISKAVAKQNWLRLSTLWREAIQLASESLRSSSEPSTPEGSIHANKKRKLANPKYDDLRSRWSSFSENFLQIQAQIERSDKNQIFSFVEGRLVQAVRDGEWLLLDEINLASPDTLDAIISLLHNGDDEKPSLLLAESGKIESVTANPNFRVFAAMNPATDTGKKDLSLALRSRFAEIFVHSGDSNLEDLTKIVQIYLGPLLDVDKRAALDLARAYIALKGLNQEHRLTDGAGEIPHFSIRSLVRCLMYIQKHSPSHSLRRAMYEGFAMSFFTVLSRASEALSSDFLEQHLLSNVKNRKSFFNQQPKFPPGGEEFVAFRHHLVKKGPISPDFQPHYIRTPSVERNLLNLARAASMRSFPILLQGPTSAGKTSMVEYLCKLSGNKFMRINNHEHTDLQEYLGSYVSGTDGKLQYREGVLVDALRQGHWIVLDELNLAPSDVLEALNRLLDDNRELLIPETQELVHPHPNFMLFATQNPAGLYGGRKRLSRAFRNRFLELHFDDIPEDELETILRERAQLPPSYCSQIVAVYKKLSLQRQSSRLFEQRNSFATLRDLFRWAARPADDRQKLACHGFMLLAERVRDAAERNIVKKTIEETMKVVIDEDVLYSLSAVPSSVQSVGTIVWTSAMRRLFVLVSEALKNNEPVLLVGETGCGKTQICQVIAEAFRRPLNIYNAHSNTETGDLIGSQRPIRNRSELAELVCNNWASLVASEEHELDQKSLAVDDIAARFANLPKSNYDQEAVERLRTSLGAYQSLFAWGDGSLVRSMKTGEHFLLDEISLADDSVLERLNSVLEPSRSILLAEKGSVDNFVIAHPSFQFLATMNPGGDYGKRELSAALRNRLTEIWVPPLSQEADILPVVENKLSPDVKHFAVVMLKFALWFRGMFHNTSSTVIPLRDLLAWAVFVNGAAGIGEELALVHGAFMVYIDSIGANPAGMTSINSSDLNVSRVKCLQHLQSLVEIDVNKVYRDTPVLSAGDQVLHVGSFSIPRNIDSSKSTPNLVFNAPTTLQNTMRIVRALQMSRPILLEGSPGVGKTAIFTALAQASGKSFTRINLSDQTDLMDLFGADAPSEDEEMGRFSWRNGPLLDAMQLGGWVLLDEMNLASQSVLEGLNACLDHRQEAYIAELDKSFTCHPEFTLFAAQNPHHQGGGRKGLPASFVNRFTVVYADSFTPEDLLCICQRKFPEISTHDLETIIATIAKTEAAVSRVASFNHGAPWEMNLRDTNRWLQLCVEQPTLDPLSHFGSVVAARFRTPAQKTLCSEICQQMPSSIASESFYTNISTNVLQIGTAFLQRDDVFQHTTGIHSTIPSALLPAAKSMITAINHNWPLIITGPVGSGKTSLIRSIAAYAGANLAEFSMNADVDTMDLIGGFEQYDPRRGVVEILRKTEATLRAHIAHAANSEVGNAAAKFLTLWATFQSPSLRDSDLLSALSTLTSVSPHFTEIEKEFSDFLMFSGNTKSKSQFVWNDGILVDALKNGSWLVLDNANLCNPSVLDRLNSLLEPDGCLTISEQHGGAKGGRVVKPHKNFRIFMTVDPRFGELSRAMRNRSLEVSLPNEAQEVGNPSLIQYPYAAACHRLRYFFSSVNSGSSPRVIEATIDNLSVSEAALTASETVHLPGLEENKQLCTDLWCMTYSNNSENVCNIFDMESAPTGSFLPQLLTMNEPWTALVGSQKGLPSAELITRTWFMVRRKTIIATKLSLAQSHAQAFPAKDLTLFEKSLTVTDTNTPHPTPAVGPFAHFLMLTLQRALDGGLKGQADVTLVESVERILGFVECLMDLFSTKFLDYSQFYGHLQMGLDIGKSLQAHVSTSSLRQLASLFGEGLELLLKHNRLELRTGFSLQTMWKSFRPMVAATASQLSAQLTLEDLITRFDGACRNLELSRAQLSVLRSRLLQTYVSILDSEQPEADLVALGDAVKGIEQQAHRGFPIRGKFEQAFDYIYQIMSSDTRLITADEMRAMVPFSPIAQTHLPPLGNQLLQCKHLSQLASMRASLLSSQASIGLQLLTQLTNIYHQPLGLLEHATEEAAQLIKAIASHTPVLKDSLSLIIENLRAIVTAIMLAHQDLLTAEAQACFLEQGAFGLSQLSKLASDCVVLGKDGNRSFEKQYLDHIHPAVMLLNAEQGIRLEQVRASLIHVSIAGLILMVPQRVFDPATYSSLLVQFHDRRASELTARIDGQRQFHKQNMGQATSLVIRILEKELDNLESAPTAPQIFRPKSSELARLQELFARLAQLLLKDLSASGLHERGSNQQLKVNMWSIVDRLEKAHRAYDDFVKPITWFAKCLLLGLEIDTHKDERLGKAGTTHEIITHTPLLSFSPEKVQLWEGIEISAATAPLKLHWLEHNALSTILAQMERSVRNVEPLQMFICVLDTFYTEWKIRLSQDQLEAAAQSRYYSYRGDDEMAQELDDRELRQLFPDYHEPPVETEGNAKIYDPRATAIRVAQLHQKTYKVSNMDQHDAMRGYIRSAFEYLGQFKDNQANVSTVSFIDMLPAILWHMENKTAEFSGNARSDAINIYVDFDVAESRKLFILVRQIQARFYNIQDQWPEHAVPGDVITSCDDILHLNISEPVAKLLVKTEKLFEVATQWQSVAAREWSVAPLIDQLTTLIISWRRLELLSWSRLLDEEQKKHEENAQAWYFVAYEAVIYNSIRIQTEVKSIQTYCEDLVRTLEEFLKTATLGQYSSRLALLNTLCQTLRDAAQHENHLLDISASVSTVIEHYDRYTPSISDSLQMGRAELEKALKEQIQLASWKDTNITALRDSARRSHLKLFRIVKKYRDLLNQPITTLKSDPDGSPDEVKKFRNIKPIIELGQQERISSAVQTCASTIPDWGSRPERLTNPLGSIKSMERVYHATISDFDAHIELAAFRIDLISNIKELRTQTPANSTDENSSLVRHLQERKRRFFAETLRNLAQMGIRRNLPVSELEKQSTKAGVLVSVFVDPMSELYDPACVKFHELLDVMADARSARKEHSDDLTEGEISRGLGLLEGLLLVSINQRQHLGSAVKDWTNLQKASSKLRSLGFIAPDELLVSTNSSHSARRLTQHLTWFSEILTFTSTILAFQAKHANLQIDELITAMEGHSSLFRELRSKLPRLPQPLSSHTAQSLYDECFDSLHRFGLLLKEWLAREPRIEFLLEKLIPWTIAVPKMMDVTQNGVKELSLQEFDQKIRDLMDKIFVALQMLQVVKGNMPTSVEDANWLVKSNRAAFQTHESMHVGIIAAAAHDIFASLQYVHPDELAAASSLLLVASPIIEQYFEILGDLIRRQTAVHIETCRLAIQLAVSFTALAREGFCRPSDPSNGEEQSGKLESGTGLGEGEGAEDISKDVGDDEDLSELAQAEGQDKNDGEIENAEDAVDMGNDDLKGETGDNEEQKSDEEKDDDRSEPEEGDDMDEETGSVDDLDPSAVDEKMWDDMKKESEQDKELKNDKAKGSKTEDQTATDGEKAEGEDLESADGAEEIDKEEEDDDGEGAERPEAQNMDPHPEDEQALDLPEELDLAGGEETKDDDISDDGMNDLSDIEDSKDELQQEDNQVEAEDKQVEDEEDEDELADEGDREGTAHDDEIVEDQPDDDRPDEQDTREADVPHEVDQSAGGETGAANEPQETLQQEQNVQGVNQSEKQIDPQQAQPGKAPENEEQGNSGKGAPEHGAGHMDTIERQQVESLRKLADVLDQWHRRREILPASDETQPKEKDEDIDMADMDFEHVNNEIDAETQALGAAAPEQAQNLDQGKAVEDDNMSIDEDIDIHGAVEPEEQENVADRFNRVQAQQAPSEVREAGAFMPSVNHNRDRYSSQQEDADAASEDLTPDIEHLDIGQQEHGATSPLTSSADATQLWNHCSTTTHQFSLVLTEQLRLILSPTTATKLRGDFRTGKRLNLKRIIPYIASGYKRDKIWMRRSVPSKRNYQIMVAVDDSKSMAESGADILAFETLSLLTKSLSMLEAGEMCVVGFGDEEHIRVAHAFGTPFSPADSGVNIFQSFSFQQRGTNVKNLIKESIQLFRDARVKGHTASEDLWQLQLILSDGHCSDHAGISRLVRQAQQEKIIIVFVIVDAGEESILDLKEAVFEQDPASSSGPGAVSEMRVRTKRYLEDFPFPYYLVVRDVRDLPGVLATALKGWFGSVVDVQV